MLRVLTVLVGWCCVCLNTFAVTDQEILKNLSDRIHPLPKQEGALIKSFSNHSQSYIYDQALAIIAFAKAGEKNKARSLLSGLQYLQSKNGSLYFSYYLDGKSPYPEEGDKRFAGAIAWVALAASHYQNEFKSDEFLSFNSKLLKYLQTQFSSYKARGKKIRAIRFAPTDIQSTSWDESETVALEHNLDAFAAFKFFAKLNGTTKWNKDIDTLKTFILSMWDSSRSHFWSGADTKTGFTNKSELYLDNQSWSLLAIDEGMLKKIKPKEALELNCEEFFVEHENIIGFMDSKPTRRPSAYQFVWSEGSLGQILAMKKFKSTCQGKSPEDLLQSIHKMKKDDNGIAYSTSTSNPDFTTASSVAGTAWLYFAGKDFNPFEVEEEN